MDKFLLAENPLRPEQSGLFIIHMLDPIAIIACYQGEVEVGKIFKHFAFQNIDRVLEKWTLSLYFANGTYSVDDLETKAFKLLDRAWRWYRAYMEEEDKNFDI